MIKRAFVIFLLSTVLALAGGPISRPSNIITGPGSSRVQINLDGSIDIVTASGTPMRAYSATARFDTGPLELGSIATPSVSGAGDVRIYWDGAHIYSSKNGGAYAIFGEGGGTIASTTLILKGDNAGNAVAATAGTDYPGLASANVFTANQSNSYSGTASTPAMKYSGVPFAGTGTTSSPLVYVNDTNATASTTLATAGTYFGVNGHGSADLLNLLHDGASFFKVDSGGNITGQSSGYNFYRGTFLMFFIENGQGVAFRSRIDAQSGSAGNPGFSFEGDTNTGIWNSGADTLDFATGGVNRMSIGTGVAIGGGTAVKLIKSATATLDFGSTSAQSSAELSITVTGAADGDDVIVSPPNGSTNANTCFTARVSAADTVQVKFNNYSSGAVDPASGTFRVTVIQF